MDLLVPYNIKLFEDDLNEIHAFLVSRKLHQDTMKSVIDIFQSLKSQNTKYSIDHALETPLLFTKILKENLKSPSIINNPDILSICLQNSLDNLSKYFSSLQGMIKIIQDEGFLIGRCTLEKSKDNFIRQKLYKCKTCKIDGRDCICEDCMKICHKSHDTSFSGENLGFCDCAFNSNPCKLQNMCTFTIIMV